MSLDEVDVSYGIRSRSFYFIALLPLVSVWFATTGCSRPEGPSLVAADEEQEAQLSVGEMHSESLPTPTPEKTFEEVVAAIQSINSGYATVNPDIPYLQLFQSPKPESVLKEGLTNPGPFEGLRTVETTGRLTEDFTEIVVPVKPNGTTAWVLTRNISLNESDVLVVIDLSERKAILYEGEKILREAPVAIGDKETPTPVVNTIVDALWVRAESDIYLAPLYGNRLFGLNQHSEALDEFGGRRPALAIHGTDEVEYIGTEISNGCIRMKPEDIDFFAQHVTLGTRVSIIP
jgi:lipoprotein-anchoring transpeptidase ErfK/SrfK